MWPHSIAVGVGRTAIVVGSDDAHLIAELEPWRVDVDRNLVDFALETDPPQPESRSAPRLLANLRHGSDRLVHSTDVAMLRESLFRMLSAYEHETKPGTLRLNGMLLEREGGAIVVPLDNARLVPVRQLQRLGFTPCYSQSVLIDVATQEVLVDARLGDAQPARRLKLSGIWLFHREAEVHVPAPVSVARVLGNSQSHVSARDAAELVRRIGVRYVGSGRGVLEKELTAP